MTIKSAFCWVAALSVLVFFGLGPPNLQPRSGLGWQFHHFVGYIVLSFIFCLAWARPLITITAGPLAIFAVLLEALQALKSTVPTSTAQTRSGGTSSIQIGL